MAMKEWGGEHVEMSLRMWRCHGQILMVPCSRIGHRGPHWGPHSEKGVNVYQEIICHDSLHLQTTRIRSVSEGGV